MTECKCDLRTKLVGDGCRYCNPQEYIDKLCDALDEREWVGLKDEEIKTIERNALTKQMAILMTQATIKEKNT